MSPQSHGKKQVKYDSCPPKEFAGRHSEREQLLGLLEEARGQGQVVLITGASGSGKSSFLDWAEHEIQDNTNGLNIPAIKKPFYETAGTIFDTYKDVLRGLKGHDKCGWFKKTLGNEKVIKYLDGTLGILEKASSFAGPAKAGIDVGAAVAKELLPGKIVEYNHLLTSFLKVLESLSDELTRENQFIAILLDDAQYSSESDFRLLKDLIKHLPQGIALVITFRLEKSSMETYGKLQQELDRFGHTEIPLVGINPEGIKEFAHLRYGLSINDETANFLNEKIGDPLCLVNCFNLLQKRNLSANLTNVKKVLPEAVGKAKCIYSQLDEQWKKRVNFLSILHPPLPLSLIARMMDAEGHGVASLQDELEQGVAFRRLEGNELFDFAHSSLREYCRERLPEDLRVELHSKAAECVEALRDRLSEEYVDTALAEHLFIGQEYEKALGLNLRLGEWQFNHFNYSLALQLTERAQTCAEKTDDKYKRAWALHQKGIILQDTFRFPDALNAYNQSLKIWQEMDDRTNEAKTLHEIGRVYEETNRFDDALDYYNQSLRIKQEIGNRAGEASTLHQIGNVNCLTNRFDDAIEYYNQSLKIMQEIGDRDGKAKTLHQIGIVYQKTNRLDDALDSCKQGLVIMRKIGDRAMEAKTLHQIGMVYEDTNRLDDALDYYNQSLEIERELGNRAGEEISLRVINALKEKMQGGGGLVEGD